MVIKIQSNLSRFLWNVFFYIYIYSHVSSLWHMYFFFCCFSKESGKQKLQIDRCNIFVSKIFLALSKGRNVWYFSFALFLLFTTTTPTATTIIIIISSSIAGLVHDKHSQLLTLENTNTKNNNNALSPLCLCLSLFNEIEYKTISRSV